MITLLLDSSFRDLAVGVAKDGKLVDFISYEAWQRQSELFIPELDSLLKRNNLGRSDISDIMVAIGPGSYTGVRIAITIAKVISFSLGIPLFAVSSLQIMKVGDRPTVSLINARSGRSYIGVYQKAQVIVKETIMTNDEVKYFLATHPDYAISGDVGYLNLAGQNVNTLEEMISLKEDIVPIKDKLGLTPVYLKE